MHLSNAEELVPIINQIMANWPHSFSDASSEQVPFMSINGENEGKFRCLATGNVEAKSWNALNAVCDLIAELSWEQIRTFPSRLCVHCAAVEFNGRLVLFPNRRRAGKSQLAAVLAYRGHRLFTDDFLSITASPDSGILGVANGILPRVRLPQPAEMSKGFEDWVRNNNGPENFQYKYLESDAVVDRNTKLPVGAIVLLDRRQTAAPELRPIDPATALNELISQNFARSTHAGHILKTAHQIVSSAELFDLSYTGAEEAADLLEATFEVWNQPSVDTEKFPMLTPREADLEAQSKPAPQFDVLQAYIQETGATVVDVGEETYLADAEGIGVLRLNGTSGAIWRLLASSMTLADVVYILSEAFPSVPADQIHRDCSRVLKDLVQNRLIACVNRAQLAAHED
jgi:hypothetical protein